MKVFGEIGVDRFILLIAGDTDEELDAFTSKMNGLSNAGYVSGGIRSVDIVSDGKHIIGIKREVVFEKVSDVDSLVEVPDSNTLRHLTFREQGFANSELTVAEFSALSTRRKVMYLDYLFCDEGGIKIPNTELDLNYSVDDLVKMINCGDWRIDSSLHIVEVESGD